MEVRIICIGKIKDKELKALINNYLSKINFYNKCSVIELKEITFSNESDTNIKKILGEEAKIIQPYLENAFNIVLAIEGKNIDSIELSDVIEKTINFSHYKFINFIIGSSHGLDHSIKKSSNLLLSFSKMTFPHQLMRLILLEQIYRTFCIIKNTNYHK